MTFIDSHVNLHASAFDEDRAEVIARARAAGVGPMITICDKLENREAVFALAAGDDQIWASLGAHPHYARDHAEMTPEALVELSGPNVLGIGETGLDLHYGFSPLEAQVAAFRAQIEAARRLDLPVIIHTREADRETAEILEDEYAKKPFAMLLHCYTSGPELAARAFALGAYISFSGILTFKNAHDVRAVALSAPLDRVILETDCPYLAPVPHRGRRCEPAMVRAVYEAFCALRGVPLDEGAERIAANFRACFPAAA